jgi:hypothetical protein
MGEDILVVKKKKGNDKMKFKVVQRQRNNWTPSKYEKVISGRDYNLLALLLCDLQSMGFDIEKAFSKFKTLTNDPELFFLK